MTEHLRLKYNNIEVTINVEKLPIEVAFNGIIIQVQTQRHPNACDDPQHIAVNLPDTLKSSPSPRTLTPSDEKLWQLFDNKIASIPDIEFYDLAKFKSPKKSMREELIAVRDEFWYHIFQTLPKCWLTMPAGDLANILLKNLPEKLTYFPNANFEVHQINFRFIYYCQQKFVDYDKNSKSYGDLRFLKWDSHPGARSVLFFGAGKTATGEIPRNYRESRDKEEMPGIPAENTKIPQQEDLKKKELDIEDFKWDKLEPSQLNEKRQLVEIINYKRRNNLPLEIEALCRYAPWIRNLTTNQISVKILLENFFMDNENLLSIDKQKI